MEKKKKRKEKKRKKEKVCCLHVPRLDGDAVPFLKKPLVLVGIIDNEHTVGTMEHGGVAVGELGISAAVPQLDGDHRVLASLQGKDKG